MSLHPVGPYVLAQEIPKAPDAADQLILPHGATGLTALVVTDVGEHTCVAVGDTVYCHPQMPDIRLGRRGEIRVVDMPGVVAIDRLDDSAAPQPGDYCE